MVGIARWERLRQKAERDGERDGTRLAGLYNRNYVVQLPRSLARSAHLPPRTKVKVRVRIKDADDCNLRFWREEQLLDALADAGGVAGAPRVLARGEGFSVQTFTPGRRLTDICPYGSDLAPHHQLRIGGLFRQVATVPVHALPPPDPDLQPADGWPRDKDTLGFLRQLVDAAARQAKDFQSRYETLFAGLDISHDLWDGFLTGGRSELAPRPFSLIHTDIHRGNLIVGDDQQLSLIDWELAMVGDPLYELASHLCRMRYARGPERDTAKEAWTDAQRQADRNRLNGLDHDLGTYIALERLQSVFNNTVRAAKAVLRSPSRLEREADVVAGTLAAAAAENLDVTSHPAGAVAGELATWLRSQSSSVVLSRAQSCFISCSSWLTACFRGAFVAASPTHPH